MTPYRQHTAVRREARQRRGRRAFTRALRTCQTLYGKLSEVMGEMRKHWPRGGVLCDPNGTELCIPLSQYPAIKRFSLQPWKPAP